MILDGRALASEIRARTKVRAEGLTRRPKVVAYVAPNPPASTVSYLKLKKRSAEEAGCDFGICELPPISDIQNIMLPHGFLDADADAIIVQLPLPPELDQQAVLDLIPVEKDADVLSKVARENFEKNEIGALLPPVVGAVKEILKVGTIEVAQKKVVVIGAGFLVGGPVATWLRQQGADVEVYTLEDNRSLTSILQGADIIVSGAGSPHLIKPDMVKEGVVLIDAGTSESSGKIVGDADPACASKCSLFTPVPGGVGPIAVAKLFENAVTLAEKAL